MLPQSTVALRASRSYSKVAYLKQSKSRKLFFSNSPSTLTQEVTQLKRPSIVKKFPKDVPFVLSLKRNYSPHWASTRSLSNVLPCYKCHFNWACFPSRNIAMISHRCIGRANNKCALSASAFIDSSLHQLDFFLEIFLRRLYIMYLKARRIEESDKRSSLTSMIKV